MAKTTTIILTAFLLTFTASVQAQDRGPMLTNEDFERAMQEREMLEAEVRAGIDGSQKVA